MAMAKYTPRGFIKRLYHRIKRRFQKQGLPNPSAAALRQGDHPWSK